MFYYYMIEDNNNAETITEPVKFTVKYKDTLKRCQKAWYKTDRGKEMTRRRALKFYYKKKGLYHPELNPDGLIERKFKRNNISITNI